MILQGYKFPPDTIRWGHREVKRNHYKRMYYSAVYNFKGTLQEFISAGLAQPVI